MERINVQIELVWMNTFVLIMLRISRHNVQDCHATTTDVSRGWLLNRFRTARHIVILTTCSGNIPHDPIIDQDCMWRNTCVTCASRSSRLIRNAHQDFGESTCDIPEFLDTLSPAEIDNGTWTVSEDHMGLATLSDLSVSDKRVVVKAFLDEACLVDYSAGSTDRLLCAEYEAYEKMMDLIEAGVGEAPMEIDEEVAIDEEVVNPAIVAVCLSCPFFNDCYCSP